MRVMVRVCDHSGAAKKRPQVTRERPKRVPLYHELIKIVRTTSSYLREVAARLCGSTNPALVLERAKVRHYELLIGGDCAERAAGAP